MEQQTVFKSIQEATKDDWQIIAGHMGQFTKTLSGRIVDYLQLLRGVCSQGSPLLPRHLGYTRPDKSSADGIRRRPW